MKDKEFDEFEKLDIKDLIADFPLKKRDEARLMVIHRDTARIEHRIFSDLIEYLTQGDCIVINETKVVKSKMFFYDSDGKKRDMLMLSKLDEKGKRWMVLTKKLNNKKKYRLEDDVFISSIEKNNDGSYLIEFSRELDDNYISKHGTVPLPEYIIKKRKEKSKDEVLQDDEDDYQTVYAKENGSVAAPTAGFHFTKELLEKIQKKGINIAKIILHIGWGTFKMVRDDPENFVMPPEHCIVSKEVRDIINLTKRNGKKIFVVGTSSMRTLEKMKDENGFVKSGEAESDIFIKPGYKFSIADAFITNLHVPHSPPLYMTTAFCGTELLLKAYKEAVDRKYRFYSYGDACLIL